MGVIAYLSHWCLLAPRPRTVIGVAIVRIGILPLDSLLKKVESANVTPASVSRQIGEASPPSERLALAVAYCHPRKPYPVPTSWLELTRDHTTGVPLIEVTDSSANWVDSGEGSIENSSGESFSDSSVDSLGFIRTRRDESVRIGRTSSACVG